MEKGIGELVGQGNHILNVIFVCRVGKGRSIGFV